MKKNVLLVLTFCLLGSCGDDTTKIRLLEFRLNGQYYSFNGYAYQYTDIEQGNEKAYDWHIYNLGQNALYIQAYDTTFTDLVFPFPAFQATYTVELTQGISNRYQATSGVFRLLGEEMGNLSGDFHFTLKNTENVSDSLLVTDGYFRIWLEEKDRFFTK